LYILFVRKPRREELESLDSRFRGNDKKLR
jgi:hypothetical protein